MEKWASVLVGYSIDVKPGETVAITGGTAAEPLLRAIYREVVARGAFPVMFPVFPGLTTDLVARGSDDQLSFVSPVERFVRTQADAMITVGAETNTRVNSGVDPGRQRLYQRARTELHQTFLQRAATGEVRWSSTLYPTDAYAQDAELATADFAEFLFAACKLNQPDPVAAWNALHDEQARLIAWLADKDDIHVVGPDTDLRLSVKGRTWINSDGHRNFPSGEIFTGPIETSATGYVRCSYPVVTNGREIADIRLRFDAGRVVDASAAKNEDYLLQTLDTDEGARYLGEFAFGTNTDITRFTRNILLDEKIGGTVHMAVGSGYPDSGSTNRSAIHWDLICDLRQGGTVTGDGQVFLRDGRIVV
ncbi:MAG: aminopeptidase [Thermomicrobiales bacterium]|jgi:aminopeptidase|nr:aminopeptidase [Thermomicrobiales bacterium]